MELAYQYDNKFIHFFVYINLHLRIYIYCRVKDDAENSAFDDNSASVIKLNDGTVLYFREVGHYLAVVCILREDDFERRGTSLL